MDASPYRRLTPREQRAPISFSHNDYLGLATDARVLASIQSKLPDIGWGSTGSRLLSGDRQITHDLEDRLALFKHKPAALVFNSGYAMNVSVLDAVVGSDDVIFADKYSHASLLDGARLSGARLIRFSHNNYEHLELVLKKHRATYQRAWIVTESVFSMDGDTANVEQLIRLKERYNAQLYIDEAHAIGVQGEHSEGLITQPQAERVDIIAGTLGKSLGSVGGFVATSPKIKSYLINQARALIYSTALPPIHAIAAMEALTIIQSQHPGREVLKKAAYVREYLSQLPYPILGDTHIIPIVIGDEEKTLQLADQFYDRGIDIPAIRYPTVNKGKARLRISIGAGHTYAQLDTLIEQWRSV